MPTIADFVLKACFTKQKKAFAMVTEMKTSLKSYHTGTKLFTGTKQASMPHEANYIFHSKVGHSYRCEI